MSSFSINNKSRNDCINQIVDLKKYLKQNYNFPSDIIVSNDKGNKKLFQSVRISKTKKLQLGQKGIFLYENGEVTPLFEKNNKTIKFRDGLIVLLDENHKLSFFKSALITEYNETSDEKSNLELFIFLRRFLLVGMAITTLFNMKRTLYKHYKNCISTILICSVVFTTYIIKKCYSKSMVFIDQSRNWTTKQDVFTGIWKLLRAKNDFDTKFDVFQEKFSYYYNNLNDDEKCFINAPHCARCSCTPLFATILAAEAALKTGRFRKKQMRQRFEKIAKYLACNNFHLDYRVSVDSYFLDDFKHIKTWYVGGWHCVGCPHRDFLEYYRTLFYKNEHDYNLFKDTIEHSVDTITCNKNQHVIRYRGGSL